MTNLNYENKRLLDVVDVKDKVIGSKSRTDVHNLGLLHRQVHVWMFDKDKNVFFQKRGIHRPAAGLLDATIGGHVNKGEHYLAAAVRETREETGILISSSDLILLGKLKNISPGPKHDALAAINNFIQSVYIYKRPIKEKDLTKEDGIPGVGFQKLSYDFLRNPDKDYDTMFLKFVLMEEIPLVLKYLNDFNN